MRAVRLRSERPPGMAAGILGTTVIHGFVAALIITAVRPSVSGPPIYAVELVAAPAPDPGSKPAPAVVDRPPEPAPTPVPPAKTKPKPPPKAKPKPPEAADTKREPTPRATSPVTPAPGETPSTGSDPVTVKTPGLDFPYPEYLRNIMLQVYRNWARPLGGGALSATVSFFILRDGSVQDIRLISRSGSYPFDVGAQGAIEAAGNAKAFGALPDGYPADVLPVTFDFKPRSQ
ncbi:MAG TPA: TonB C-terminal domain-containing protein [Gemmatimonadales bacterium]|nr:TonB C-terminal domain-containing protein [Gemmatimonadales bacterium]